mgnify:FL=1|jgi:uncharacterized protein (DUF1015 family)|tara:strand:+ start:338 stop:586 length:249 start_codon:yes stop_codon:yes gene_type:complete
MKNDNLLIKENKKSYYIYKISNNSHSQIGVVGKVELSKYDDKNILGHEETFKKRVSDRKKFMPPKSTWFHPKPLDGLISSEL